MARRLPPLNALRAFEAAARHNGFTGAAAELRVSHAAISRHVRALEARLGVTLFRKAKRGVELTAGGQRYLQAVSAAFDSIAAATDTVATAAPAQIRASVHPAFAGRWLIHHLGGFRQAYPDYDVVLDATPRAVDLEHDEADLAIRIGEGKWPGVGADLLVRSRLYPVGAPTLLSRRGSAFTPPELAQFVLLHDEDDGGAWRHWFAAAGHCRRRRQPRPAHPRIGTCHRCRDSRPGHRPRRRLPGRRRSGARPAGDAVRFRPRRLRLLSADARRHATAATNRRVPPMAVGGDRTAAQRGVSIAPWPRACLR
jgi:LysR family glycine cleavage system transcriptional activator